MKKRSSILGALQEPNLPEKPNICCGYPTDTGESLSYLAGEDNDELANPRAGDIALCLNCGAFLAYLNEQNVMRLAQSRDLAALDLEQLRRLKKLRKYIRQRGRVWPRKRGGKRFYPN
jgi:hypothetical protein